MKWGLSGTNDGEFYHPGDIEADSSGNLYVADINNARIQKFDSEGNFIMKWGSSGEGDGQFDHPGDVIVDEANEAIYVTDIGNNRTYHKYLRSFSNIMAYFLLNCLIKSGYPLIHVSIYS
jgi:DNA-binding beta-propeller fold protein YncE